MWNVVGTPEPHDWVEFDPVEILDDFDFPRIFTCKDIAGNLYLAYNCGIETGCLRFLVVPCNDYTVSALVKGQLNLRDSLSKRRAWIFDIGNRWETIRAWKVDVDNLPYDALPRPGTMLYSDLPQIIVVNTTRSRSSTTELTYRPHNLTRW